MKRFSAVVAAAVVGLLAGCGGSDLKSDDPQGFEACEWFDKSMAEDAGVEVGFGGVLLAGKAASKAKTKSIRESAEPMFEDVELDGATPNALADTYTIDRDALRGACADAGYEFNN